MAALRTVPIPFLIVAAISAAISAKSSPGLARPGGGQQYVGQPAPKRAEPKPAQTAEHSDQPEIDWSKLFPKPKPTQTPPPAQPPQIFINSTPELPTHMVDIEDHVSPLPSVADFSRQGAPRSKKFRIAIVGGIPLDPRPYDGHRIYYFKFNNQRVGLRNAYGMVNAELTLESYEDQKEITFEFRDDESRYHDAVWAPKNEVTLSLEPKATASLPIKSKGSWWDTDGEITLTILPVEEPPVPEMHFLHKMTARAPKEEAATNLRRAAKPDQAATSAGSLPAKSGDAR